MRNNAHMCFSNNQLIFRMCICKTTIMVCMLFFFYLHDYLFVSLTCTLYFCVDSSLLIRQLEHRVSVQFGQKLARDLTVMGSCVPKVASASPRSLHVTDWRTVVLMTSLTKWAVSNYISLFSFLLLLPNCHLCIDVVYVAFC